MGVSLVMSSKRVLCVLVFVISATVSLHGSSGGFTATLSAEQQLETGVAGLTDAERDALNSLVAAEVALARQGEVSGFAGTFSSRRNDDERAATGIERMTADEVAGLDRLVAALIASGPSTRDIPVKLRREVSSPPKDRLEVHGEISFTYGRASGGRDFQGGSMTTTIFDTKTGSSLSFTYGQYEGDFLPYYGGRYYSSGPFRADCIGGLPERSGFGRGRR